MKKLVELNNVGLSIPDEVFPGSDTAKQILNDITFDVSEGEILGVTGESGSGKTTLMKLIAGITVPTKGKISRFYSDQWNNLSVNPVQILFQNNSEILNPFRQVGDIVREALEIRHGSQQDTDRDRKLIFNSLGLHESIEKRKGFELSGGERQRTALARILAAKPELLILDEPFSAQDVVSQLNLIDLFRKINKEFNLTMICVAHNLRVLRKLADRIIVIYEGRIVESGSTESIFNSPQNDYTKFLLKCENYDLQYEELKQRKSL